MIETYTCRSRVMAWEAQAPFLFLEKICKARRAKFLILTETFSFRSRGSYIIGYSEYNAVIPNIRKPNNSGDDTNTLSRRAVRVIVLTTQGQFQVTSINEAVLL